MKVAYMLGALRRGGTETLLLDVFRNAGQAEFDLIGIHRGGGELAAAFYAAAPAMFHLKPRWRGDFVYLLRLRKILKKHKIDIIHAHQTVDVFCAWLATLGMSVRIVQTFHGFDTLNHRSPLLALTARISDRNFFVSNFLKNYYTKKYNLPPARQTTVYNGISLEKIDSRHETPDFLQQAKEGAVKIAMIGNFVYTRDQYSLCRFLKLLKNQGVNFEFYFVGLRIDSQASLYDDCLRYCSENDLLSCVHFTGGRDDVPAILQHIDAFVYSTNCDTFGIAVIEAIAAGVPVFVNDWGVMQEITEDGALATLYKTKDDSDLLLKFSVFLQNKNTYMEKAQKAAQTVRQKYSIKTHIKNLAAEYTNLEFRKKEK